MIPSSPLPGSTRPAAWARRLGIDLRPGEGRLAASLVLAHFLILAFQYTAKSVRQASFVDELGATQLPFVYLLVAFVAYPVLAIHGRLAARFTERQVLIVASLAAAAMLLVFWGLFGEGRAWVSVLFYLWTAIAGIFLVSLFWSYASHVLDARQARRLFGVIGAGGLLGSVAGGLFARVAARAFETRAALLAAAVVLLAAAWLLRGSRDVAAGSEVGDVRPEAGLDEAKTGWDRIRGSTYLKALAGLTLLSSAVSEIVDLQFSWGVETSTSNLAERTSAFGTVYSAMGVAAFVFQIVFTTRIHRQFGLAAGLRALPAGNALGAAAFGVAAIFAPELVLPVVWMLKLTENGLRYSLDQATRELLFQPVAAADRPHVKAFIDVFVQRAARGLGAIGLLTVTFGWLTVPQTAWIVLVASLVWLVLCGSIRKHYLASFRDGLVGRASVSERPAELDASTLEMLFGGLGSVRPREVLHCLTLLEVHGRGRLVPPLLVHHPEPEVRRRVLEVLAGADRRDAAPLVETLVGDPDADVRATATRVLAALAPSDVATLMRERLRDSDPRVRGAALAYLDERGDADDRAAAAATLGEMMRDGDPEVRAASARVLGDLDDPHHQAAVVALLFDRDPRVGRAAIDAVRRRVERRGGNPLYVPILVSRLRDRRLKHDARTALGAYGESVVPALRHFLDDPQEDIWVRRALPKTIAHVGGGAASATLLAALEAGDPFLRRKVVEALVGARLHGAPPAAASAVEAAMALECRGYLQAVLDLWGLGAEPRFRLLGPRLKAVVPSAEIHFVERLLADRATDHLQNLFGLLALLHPPRDVRAAHRGLVSERGTARAHALEYLDSLLTGEARRRVFAVIDDVPNGERRRTARRLFGLAQDDLETTLRRLAGPRPIDDHDAAWLAAAALHFVADRGLERLFPLVARAANDPDPRLQEAAAVLRSRCAGSSSASG